MRIIKVGRLVRDYCSRLGDRRWSFNWSEDSGGEWMGWYLFGGRKMEWGIEGEKELRIYI